MGTSSKRSTVSAFLSGASTVQRAIELLRILQRRGEDPQDFILREYILNGRLHGYLPLDVAATDPALSTWKLAQLAEAYYASRS